MSILSRRQFASLMALQAAMAQNPPLTARGVVERIQAKIGVPWNPKSYRDTFKCGNPDTPVKGISSTFMATLDVIQRSHAAGLNFVITHEPTFWSDRRYHRDSNRRPALSIQSGFHREEQHGCLAHARSPPCQEAR